MRIDGVAEYVNKYRARANDNICCIECGASTDMMMIIISGKEMNCDDNDGTDDG